MSSQKILKEIIITSILCQSWEVIFCSSINCARKTIFSLLLTVNSPNMQARPPFNDTCYVSGYQQIIMPLIAEKFASDVAGCSPRSTNLLLMLWPQEQKGKHIKSIWQCWQQQDFFAQLKWLLPPTSYHFLHLVCKMEAGRRGRSWALGCSGRSWSLLPQETAWHC